MPIGNMHRQSWASINGSHLVDFGEFVWSHLGRWSNHATSNDKSYNFDWLHPFVVVLCTPTGDDFYRWRRRRRFVSRWSDHTYRELGTYLSRCRFVKGQSLRPWWRRWICHSRRVSNIRIEEVSCQLYALRALIPDMRSSATVSCRCGIELMNDLCRSDHGGVDVR